MITHGPTPLEGGDGGDIDGEIPNGDVPERKTRINSSRSAPVSRTQQREPMPRRVGSAKSRTAEDKLRRAALRNATKVRASAEKVSIPVNPVKISYAHAGNPRAGIFAGNLPMNGMVDMGESDDAKEPGPNGATRRNSTERRMLIEEVLRDSKKLEYMPKASHVVIGDLLSSAPRLERRLVQNGGSNINDGMPLMHGEEVTSSTETIGSGGWPSPRHRSDSASPSNDSSLPPVPAGIRKASLTRDVHTSPVDSQHREGRKATGRTPVNLNPARIPVISYSKRGQHRDSDGVDGTGYGRNENRDTRDDPRYLKVLILFRLIFSTEICILIWPSMVSGSQSAAILTPWLCFVQGLSIS